MRAAITIVSRILAAAAALAPAGCAVQRGRDFGHWAGMAEPVRLVRVYNVDESRLLTTNAVLLLLPAVNDMPQPYRADFQHALLKQLQYYTPARVVDAEPRGSLAEYLKQENIAPTAGQFDFQECGRIGQLLGATHVICCRVKDYRLNPHQLLQLYMAIIESTSGRVIAELDGTFDAAEQQTVLALDDYLQARRSREYDKTNLEIILRSPSEYASFVNAQCCRALAMRIWPPR